MGVAWAAHLYDGVEIQRSADGGAYVTVATVPGSAAGTWADTTVTAGVTYRYQVRGLVGGAPASAWSAAAATTTAATTTAAAATAAAATAGFVRDDNGTQGDWVAAGAGGTPAYAYGRDGYVLAGGGSAAPSYVTVTTPGAATATWAASVPGHDARAARTSPAAAGADDPRLAAAWHTNDTAAGFDVDPDFADGQTHRVSFYVLDWDGWYGRAEGVSVRDADTGAALTAPRAEAAYFGGRHVVFDLSGRVAVHFASTGALNAVLGGVFFDPTTAPDPTAVAALPLPQVSGPAAAAEGVPYALALANADPAVPVDHWVVDWGDQSDTDADGHVGQGVSGTAASVDHIYTAPSPAGGFRVTATAYDGADEAVAHSAATALGLDDTFAPGSDGGAGGLASVPAAQASTVARDPATGRVAVAGNGFVGVLAPDGAALDPAWHGGAGVPTAERVMSMAFDAQGRLYTAGYINWQSDVDFIVTRYTNAGAPDTTFGSAGTGVVRVDFGGGYDQPAALAPVPGGGVVVAGVAVGGATAGAGGDVAVARLTDAGLPDASFGAAGTGAAVRNMGWYDAAADVAVVNGRVVVGGYAGGAWAVARLTAAGGLDPAFGGAGGVARLDWTWENDFGTGVAGADPEPEDGGLEVEADASGKLVVAGTAGRRVAVARLNADGAPDASFGAAGTGTAATPWWAGPGGTVRLRRDAAGRLVPAFDRVQRNPGCPGQAPHLAAARLTAAGLPDASFGAGGILDTPLSASDPTGAVAAALAVVAADGSVVAGGQSPAGGAGAVRVRPTNAVTVNVAVTIALDAVPVSDSAINLSWVDTHPDARQHRLERSPDLLNWTTVATVPAGTSSYSDTGLARDTTYYYQVAAGTGSDQIVSPWADATTFPVPPAAPVNLTVTTVSDTTLALSWTDTSDNEDGFTVERRTGGGTYAEVVTVAANTTAYVDGGLDEATTYDYRVRAFNAGGTTAYATGSATTLPAAPASLVADPYGNVASQSHSVNISWDDHSHAETATVVERSGNGVDFTEIKRVGPDANSVTDATAVEGTTYWYRAHALGDGGPSADSNTSQTFVRPAAPTGLTATPISAGGIDLARADHSGHETGFLVDRATMPGGPYARIGSAPANTTSYSDTGLTAGQRYYYRVRAVAGPVDSAADGYLYADAAPDLISISGSASCRWTSRYFDPPEYGFQLDTPNSALTSSIHVDWGDGRSNDYASLSEWSQSGTHTYDGSQTDVTIRVTAALHGQSYTSNDLHVHIENVPPAASVRATSMFESASTYWQLVLQQPAYNQNALHWAVDWGDGQSETADSTPGQNWPILYHYFPAGLTFYTITATATGGPTGDITVTRTAQVRSDSAFEGGTDAAWSLAGGGGGPDVRPA